MADVRNNIVAWAKYLQGKASHFTYTEGPQRMADIGVWPLKYPITADCSAFVTLVYWLAGAGDPNGQHYDHEGYTGTLLAHGQHVTIDKIQAGDLVVYGGGTGEHTALIVEVDGKDILTISHGQQGDPSYVWVNKPSVPARGHGFDGRTPQTFLHFNTASVGTQHQVPLA